MSDALARVVIRSLKTEDTMAHVLREVGEIGRDLAVEAESIKREIRERRVIKCRLRITPE